MERPLSLMTDIMMVKFFFHFVWYPVYLTAPVVAQNISSLNYLSLIPYILLPYLLQRVCSWSALTCNYIIVIKTSETVALPMLLTDASPPLSCWVLRSAASILWTTSMARFNVRSGSESKHLCVASLFSPHTSLSRSAWSRYSPNWWRLVFLTRPHSQRRFPWLPAHGGGNGNAQQ